MTRHRYRALLAVLVVLSAVLVGVVAAPVPANAAASCSGTITWASSLKKEPRAQLVIYYSSSDGGTNSACMYHAGSTYGKPFTTAVEISRCQAGSHSGGVCTVDRTSRLDKGLYSYYAGPVGVTGTARRCVVAWGTILLPEGGLVRIDSYTRGCP
jgi:hypothetical protein